MKITESILLKNKFVIFDSYSEYKRYNLEFGRNKEHYVGISEEFKMNPKDPDTYYVTVTKGTGTGIIKKRVSVKSLETLEELQMAIDLCGLDLYINPY